MWKTLLRRALASLGLARAQPAALPAPSKKAEPYRWHAEVNFGVVTIGGETPSEDFKRSLAEAARKAGAVEVHDNSLVRAAPPAGWQAAALCAVEVHSGLRSGHTYVTNRRLTVEGVALNEVGYERIRALRGGKGERGFSVSVAGVARPIPAAPLGPPPPEAMIRDEPTPPEEAPPQPQRKRAPRKTPAPKRAPAASDADQDAAKPAPKRTRAPRRKAVEAEAAPAETEPPAPEAKSMDEPPARKSAARKPATRKPATRKPAAAKAAPAPAEAEQPARKPRPSKAKPTSPRPKKAKPSAKAAPDAPAPSPASEGED